MDIEQSIIDTQNYSYEFTQPTTNSSSTSSPPECPCFQAIVPHENQQQTLTLSQNDFVNADLVLQYIFLYVLRKTGGEEESAGYLKDGCQYLLCKYFSAQYSVGCNHSLKVRINYLDPSSRDASKIVCQPIVLARTMKSRQSEKVEACQHFSQSLKIIQGKNLENVKKIGYQDGIAENQAVILQIEALVNQYGCVFQQPELEELGSMLTNVKTYLQGYHERMKQVKRYHILSERRLQEICENRLRLMEKVAKDWVAKHCEETDFVLITYVQADFSSERQRMKQLELNPALLSLFGTESTQFTSLIMRHGMQLCHNETNIVETLLGFTEWFIQSNPSDVYEFESKNQTLVLIDKVITTCDIRSICFTNLWDEQEPFIPKQTPGQYMPLDAVAVSRFFLPPEQIKEILAIRMEHQSLDLVSIQEASIDYTVQSETFCEKFYPEVKAELDKMDRENNQQKRICVTKNIL